MVDIVGVQLEVDSEDVKKAIKVLSGLADQSKKTEKATDSLLDTFKKYYKMIAAATVLWQVIDAHREFQKSVSELSAITGAVGDDLKYYREQAILMGSSTTFAASEVVSAFKLVASAKPDLLANKEALAAVTKEVLTLAEASGMALPDAANALGGALNQFGAGAESANRFINVLAAGAKFGASEINMTAEAMKNVGAVASSVGLSFEETNAAIQALAAVSIKGAEAGTGLRGVLLKLSTQSKDQFNPEIVGLEQALKNLRDAHLTTTEMAQLFGQESITAATALIKQADSVGELTKNLTGTATAMEQASINTDNLDGDMKKMYNSWKAAAILAGEALDPAFRIVAKTLGWLGQVVQTVAIEFGDLIDLMKTYASVAAAVATLDFAAAKELIKAREQRRADTDRRVADIWREKTAEEEALEAKKKAAESEAALMADTARRREEAAAKATERRRKEAQDRELDQAIEEERQNAITYEANAKKLKDEQDYYDRLYNLQAGSQQASLDLAMAARNADMQGMLQQGALALSNVAKQNKTMFGAQKAFALANAAVTLPSAVLKSFHNGGGFPWGLIPAGLMLANGLAQINAIRNTEFGGSTSTPSVSGGAGGTSPSAPVASGLPPGSTALPGGGERPAGTTVNIAVEEDGVYSGRTIRSIMEGINEQIRNGAVIEGIVA